MEIQLQDIKQHEAKLMEKVMEFTDKMARIETSIHNQDKVVSNLGKDLKDSIDSRMDSIQSFIASQSEVQNKILEIQGRQSEQISSIQKTLEEFTDIRNQVAQHESRIKALEEQIRSENEIRKENTKGRWATMAAVVAAIGSIIATLVTTLLR